MSKRLPIGIFDSGLGGLTVLKKLQEAFPQETFIYIGDTAHLPYGNKSKQAIIEYSELISKYLIKQKVKLIIVACNTASSLALSILRQRFQIGFIDVITPMSEALKHYQQYHKIGVIGTHNTVKSNAYYNILAKHNPKLEIFQQACPLLVPLIEEDLHQGIIADLIIEKYLKNLIKNNIQVLILGCTHYPLIKESIKRVMGTQIIIIDSATATTEYLKEYLNNNQLLSSSKEQQDQIIITDQANNFESLALKILNTNKLNLEILKITK
ncbi:MAG: glutamate racemase [Candidatus Marinimicrobia bacterium]|nr:glutamate racemase [Candidatus Neomarinimicrobiota bacterium]|tara:strand:+ start:18723 stop:19526 length:804 start_codon:yes stop_codon:yes gene_type:complete